MSCAERYLPSQPSHEPTGRRDIIAGMYARRLKGHSRDDSLAMRRKLGPDPTSSRCDSEASDSMPILPPTPRGGARGPLEARAARAAYVPAESFFAIGGSFEDTLPQPVRNADFKTLQAMITKGIRAGEEDGALLEHSLGGGEWGALNDAEERRWRQQQKVARDAEQAARAVERERARELRQQLDEERRRRQMEALEEELLEEKRRDTRPQDEQTETPDTAACRRSTAAVRIQACYRGRLLRRACC